MERYILKSEYLFVFDIETIIDHDVVNNLLENDNISSISQAREALIKYHLEITDGKNAFPRQLFHKIVTISYILVKVEYLSGSNEEFYTLKYCKSAGTENSSEYDLVKGFFDTVDKYKPKIVTFNGKTFDIPVLKYRAMKYGIAGCFFHQSETKWEGYNKRYALNWHCDLIDALSDFGLSARIKLNEVCAILGFPGKVGVSGANVQDMYDQGKLKAIRDYCETDVLNTYLVYLRYMHHICVISTDTYNTAIKQILSLLEGSKEASMIEFLEQWKLSNNDNFFL